MAMSVSLQIQSRKQVDLLQEQLNFDPIVNINHTEMVKQQRLEHISSLNHQLIALQKGIGQEKADIAHL